MGHIKDTDYLALSSRIKAMENTLLSRERMEHLLEARSNEEVSKILQDCGYPEFSGPQQMDEALTSVREEMLADLSASAPDPRYIEIFKLKYDYHNLKVLLKAEALDVPAAHMLMDFGRVPAAVLQEAVTTGDFADVPATIERATAEAREILGATADPQLSDIALDRCCYAELLALAESIGSEFLTGYVRLMIDALNLRSLVRTLRMGKTGAFLDGALLPGGEVVTAALSVIANSSGSGLIELYASTPLRDAAEAGAAAIAGGGLTKFERLCDDAVGDYLADAKYVAFGEAPLVGYLAARETEFTNLRILLMGRAMGLDAGIIRERLREAYV
ncbi:MAG: V-type ATPase subunit [Oscillospiraceae bacterium]